MDIFEINLINFILIFLHSFAAQLKSTTFHWK